MAVGGGNDRLSVAYYGYRFASTDKQRAAASRILKEELERQKLALDAKLRREVAAREEQFHRDVALLEEEMKRDVQSKDNVAAVRKACVELCREKLEIDPEGASLYATAILSWDQTRPPAWRTNWPLRDEFVDALKSRIHQWKEAKEGKNHFKSPPLKIFVRLAKMKPEEIKRMAADMQVILSNRGYAIPEREMTAAFSATVKIDNKRSANRRRWKELTGSVSSAASVVVNVVTTVQAVKHISKDDFEPLLACRHYLPDGWFF